MSTAVDSRSDPPVLRGRFLFGHVFQYFSDATELFRRAQREHGDVVGLRLLPWQRTYLLSNPDDIEQVLRRDHRHFSKDKLTHSLSTFLGNGLVTSEGDFWKRQRHLIQPGFQHDRVNRYAEIMTGYTERMTASWRNGETRPIHLDMMQVTLEIVARALFDADAAREGREVGASLESIMDFFRNPLNWPGFRQWIPTPSLLRFRKARKRLFRIIDEIVRERRESRKDAGDLLEHLLEAQDEAGTQMTNQQLRDELITLLLAGHETTALALTYAVYLLSGHAAVEDKLLEELSQVLGERSPTVEDLPKLAYADQVIREVMRLYPPVWVIGREALADVEIGGYAFPKGSQFDFSQWVVHRDARWYDAPDEFRPERWTDAMKENLPRGAYFPFGDGPRVCVGNYFAMIEAVLVLTTMYQRYRFESKMTELLGVVPSITLRPKQPVMMQVVKRSAT